MEYKSCFDRAYQEAYFWFLDISLLPPPRGYNLCILDLMLQGQESTAAAIIKRLDYSVWICVRPFASLAGVDNCEAHSKYVESTSNDKGRRRASLKWFGSWVACIMVVRVAR